MEGRFDVRLSLFILFIAAFAPQVVLIYDAYWIMSMPNPYLVWSALALSCVCVALMVALALATQNPGTRWLSVGLVGIVILAFSALTIISLGLLTAPIALALIIMSIIMLIRNRRSLPAVA